MNRKRVPGALPGISGDRGFVVFGVLLVLAGIIASAVVLGIIVDRINRPPPPIPVERELRYVTAPLEVRFGALTTRRFDVGEPLWVRIRDDGEVLVFDSKESNLIVGYARAEKLDVTPPDRSRARRARVPDEQS